MSRPQAFVLMPLDDEFNEVYEHLIRDTLEEAGYEPERADSITSVQNILIDIVGSIVDCELVVADLTSNNPNVFYEVGVAHALGQKVVLLAQDIAEVPFDLQGYRVIEYSTHFKEMEDARRQLLSLAQKANSNDVPFGSPVSDYASSQGVKIHELSNSITTRVRDDFQYEEGVLDRLASFEEAALGLFSSISAINELFESVTSSAKEFGRKRIRLEKKQRTGSRKQGNLIALRKSAQVFASDIDGFADAVREQNANYAEALDKLEGGLDFILQPESLKQVSPEDVNSFIDNLSEAIAKARGTRDAVANTGEIMLEGHGIEKSLSKSLDKGESQLAAYVKQIDRTISIFERATAAAQKHKK